MRFQWLTDITEEQGERLIALANEVLRAGGTGIGYQGPLADVAARELLCDWQSELRGGRRHLLVAEARGGAFAAAVFLTPDRQPNCRHRAEITKAMVTPTARGLGVLLGGCRAIVGKAEELGVELLTLDVRAGTPAERLWRRLGFRENGRLMDYAREGDCRFDGVFLSQSVAELRQRMATGRAFRDIRPRPVRRGSPG